MSAEYPVAENSCRLAGAVQDVEEVAESAEFEAAARARGESRRDAHNGAGGCEQQRVGQRAVTQAAAAELLDVSVAVAVGPVERRARQAMYEAHRGAFRRCRRYAILTLQARAHVHVRSRSRLLVN